MGHRINKKEWTNQQQHFGPQRQLVSHTCFRLVHNILISGVRLLTLVQ